MAQQLRMFPPARPFSSRFGREFFRSIPKEPGVYLMEDARGRILYVGKAKNLRNRLSSYRYLNPDRASRKSIRLVHAVEKITWQLCASDLDAQLRENLLLQTHHPKFNRVNVYPKAHCFIGLRYADRILEVRFLRSEPEGFRLFGAFKPGAIFGYAALLRLLWATSRGSFAIAHFPLRMLGSDPAREFSIEMEEELAMAVAGFLEGSCARLLELVNQFNDQTMSPFEAALLRSDEETLRTFFENGTRRAQAMRSAFDVPGTVIPQELLNDLLVRERHSRFPSGESSPGNKRFAS